MSKIKIDTGKIITAADNIIISNKKIKNTIDNMYKDIENLQKENIWVGTSAESSLKNFQKYAQSDKDKIDNLIGNDSKGEIDKICSELKNLSETINNISNLGIKDV